MSSANYEFRKPSGGYHRTNSASHFSDGMQGGTQPFSNSARLLEFASGALMVRHGLLAVAATIPVVGGIAASPILITGTVVAGTFLMIAGGLKVFFAAIKKSDSQTESAMRYLDPGAIVLRTALSAGGFSDKEANRIVDHYRALSVIKNMARWKPLETIKSENIMHRYNQMYRSAKVINRSLLHLKQEKKNELFFIYDLFAPLESAGQSPSNSADSKPDNGPKNLPGENKDFTSGENGDVNDDNNDVTNGNGDDQDIQQFITYLKPTGSVVF